jgi:hypothetical protein
MTTPFREIWVDGPDGQSLCALISGDVGWLVYLREPGDAGFSSRNPAYAGPAEAVTSFVLSNGQKDEYPSAWLYPLAEVERAIGHFRATGMPPPFITWHSDSGDSLPAALRPRSASSFDYSSFWEQSEYATREYVGPSITPRVVAEVEARLGYQLPAAYIALARSQNGGIPRKTSHRTASRTSWAEDHVAIAGIFSIGSDNPSSLCGESGSRFWVEEWGYPDIGIYFADCPSAGHDMLCLDYRACGPQGEPTVAHVDQELDYAITPVAPDFESFLRGLENIGEG